ncbi:MAG: type IV toxin-antitoxin system AbiEi family antitoxin domain-containing protein [Acidimicrobiia bacterium]|nr:type IV toxin-antitoxin system AbiEi family antitoxin domain-containing protein [Acidimicrobiia bacterium]
MKVNSILRDQHGLITREQARTALRPGQIRYRVDSGEWVEPHPGVYRHSAIKPTWESRLLAAVLSTDGVASHRCAAALWNLELYRRPPVELTVPEERRARRNAVRIHGSTQWDRIDRTVRRGIPCTGIERTVLDCGAVAGSRTVERLAESAIRQRLTTWPELVLCLERHSRSGRNGCGNLRVVVERRINDATVPLSDFSRVVVNLLEDAGLPPAELEYPILDDDGNLVLQVDLAWPSLKKCWELDGLAFHFAREAVERDRRKRNRAKALGWNMQEILWSMYADEPHELVRLARNFLTPDSS